MKRVSRWFLDNPDAVVADPLSLDWGYDMPKIKYQSWAETSKWLLVRASVQAAMSELFHLPIIKGSELRNAAFEMFKSSIVYMVFYEVAPELVPIVDDWLALQTIEDSDKIAELVNLLTEREPNPTKIAEFMRMNL